MPKYLLASEIVDKVMPEGDMWGDFVNGPVHDGDPGDENDSPSPEEIDYLLGGYRDPATDPRFA